MKCHRPIILLLLSALFLSGCGALLPAQEPARPLRIEYQQQWSDYTILVAQEKGFFEKHGVQVEPVYYETFSESLSDLAAGDIDMGLFALGDALNVARHTDLKVIAVYDNGGFNAVLSMPAMQTIADLRGQSIGVRLGTTHEMFVLEMLKAGRLSAADVTLVDLEPENIAARLGYDIAAGFTYEPYITEAISQGNKILFSSEQVSGLNPNVIVVRSEIADRRPDEVRAFLRAWFEAVGYRYNNSEVTRRIIAERLGLSLDEIQQDHNIRLATLEDNKEFFELVPPVNYLPIRETARTNGDFLIRIGTLSGLPDLNAFLDPSFLE